MLYILLATGIIALDQFTKWQVRRFLVPGDEIPVIGRFLRISCVYNQGAAFGILSGKRTLLIGIAFAVLLVLFLFVLLNRKMHPLPRTALTMIAAGGFGNLIDRAVYGQVTDMIKLSFFPPAFNVADIAVTIGCVLVFVYALFGERLGAGKARSAGHRKRS